MKTFTQWYAEHKHLNFGEAQECYEDYRRIYRPLDLAEHVALAAFAKEYGREWKQYLMAAWLSHKYKGVHMGGKDTGTLRQIRNSRGHSWLHDFKTSDLTLLAASLPAVGSKVSVVTNFGMGPVESGVEVVGHGEKNGKRLIDYERPSGERRWAYLSQIVRS